MLIASLSLLLAAAPSFAETGAPDTDTDTTGSSADTDCDRADTADTDIEDCSDDVSDDEVVTGGKTAGELVGEQGGASCQTGGRSAQLGWLAGALAIGAIGARRRHSPS